MRLTEYFQSIGAYGINTGADEDEILAAEAHLEGRFPAGLRGWLREANGFESEARTNMWRFPALQRLHTIFEVFGLSEVVVPRAGHAECRVAGREYVIVCDALIHLPFYAVNIRPDSPHYAEVLCGHDQSGPGRSNVIDVQFAVSGFEAFTDWLFTHPNDCIYDGN